MGSPTRYACYGKDMFSRIHKKMVIQKSTSKSDKFFASSSIVAKNDTSICKDSRTVSKDYSTASENDSKDNAHIFILSNRGEKLSEEPSTLVQCAQRTSGSLDG
jgi:hypothetical protein